MSVVGIDFGTAASYIAVARNRGIDVITNEVSNRSTPTLVSFGSKQRYLGEQAKTQEVSNIKNTIGSLKRLIGLKFDDPEVEHEKQFENVNFVNIDGDLGVEVNYLGEPKQFTITQLVAMYLTKLKNITKNEMSLEVAYLVLGVPGWYKDSQRRALLNACEIAGLNCLRLMNEIAATSLGYGITKTDLPETEERNILIIDIGHSSLSVAAVSYIKGKLDVKATAYDKHCGGRYIDKILMDHFTEVFKEKYKIDVKSNKKAIFRLNAACEKAKKVLSANLQAPLNIESLMEDMDVNAMINREEFEEMIKDQIERVSGPISRVLEQCGWTMDQVYSVELVGGSSRIPAFKEAIKKLLDKELSFTVNQDEAIARGCALCCAIMSPVFKVRDFAVNDVNHYPIQFSWASSQDGKTSTLEVFPRNQAIPCTKVLTFYRKADFEIKACYVVDKKSNILDPYIATFYIKNVVPNENDPKGLSTVKVKARMNIHGIISIEQAYMVNESKEEENKEESEDKNKKLTTKEMLEVDSKTTSLNENNIEELKRIELEMESTDKLVIDTEYAKNNLEEYVYDQRSKIQDSYEKFIDPNLKQQYLDLLNEYENWLYEDGEDAKKSEYMEKLNKLKEFGEPVRKVYIDNEMRPSSIKKAREEIEGTIQNIEKIIQTHSDVDSPYSHIELSKLENILNEANELKKWLKEGENKIKSLPLYEQYDKDFNADKVDSKLSYFNNMVTRLLNTPKPKPKKEEPKEEPKKEEPKKEETKEEDKMQGDNDMDID